MARASSARRLTDLMGEAWARHRARRAPVALARGRRPTDPGLVPAAPPGRHRAAPPLVLEIHGGPQTLYGWSLMWEWQCLVAQGISVYACNPRGSQGYGQDFCCRQLRRLGHRPDGRRDGRRRRASSPMAWPIPIAWASPGGSYGGYLTSWIVGHTDRFRAAVTCRSVNDMTSQMETGDIAGPQFGQPRVRRQPVAGPRALPP